MTTATTTPHSQRETNYHLLKYTNKIDDSNQFVLNRYWNIPFTSIVPLNHSNRERKKWKKDKHMKFLLWSCCCCCLVGFLSLRSHSLVSSYDVSLFVAIQFPIPNTIQSYIRDSMCVRVYGVFILALPFLHC